MNVTNANLVYFINNFQTLGPLQGFDFVLEINRNFEKALEEVRLLEKVKSHSPEMEEYTKGITKLYTTYSEKQPNGKPVIAMLPDGSSQYIVAEDNKGTFAKEVEKLRTQFKKALDIHEQKEENYVESLRADSKVKFYKFKKDEVPEDINTQQMRILFAVQIVK